MTVFTDKNEKQSVIAAAVKSSSGGAYGTGEIVVKKSEDNGLHGTASAQYLNSP